MPEKWVCLTFDDGPSKTTPAVLDALNTAGVKATFFVVATGYNEKYLPLIADAAAAGHQIALHSASHEYSDIYQSADAYWQDIELLKQRIMDTEVGEFVRTGIASVLGQLYLDGRLPETEWKAIIRQVIHQAREYEHVLDKMAEMICECHFIDMLGEIRYLFDHDLIDEHFVGGYDAHVDLMFNYGKEHRPYCQSPIDAAQILRNWAMFKDEDSADAERILIRC